CCRRRRRSQAPGHSNRWVCLGRSFSCRSQGSPGMPEAVSPAPTELVLGRYRPLRPLGSGGSGSVWLAHDTQLDVEVALKIVPRDVKPANVLLADGDGVDARLLDFGLAQLPEAETLTAVGDVPGTLAYISPERLANEPAGPAADVWAVGVLLWEALAGWHPF